MKKKDQVFLCIMKSDDEGKLKEEDATEEEKRILLLSMLQKPKYPQDDREGETWNEKNCWVKERTPDIRGMWERSDQNTMEEHWDKQQKIIMEYQDIFWDKLLEGAPPFKLLTHSIEVSPSNEPTYWTPYKLWPLSRMR